MVDVGPDVRGEHDGEGPAEAGSGCGVPVGSVLGRVAPGALARAARVDALEGRGRELAGVLATAAAGLVGVIAEAIEDDLWTGCGIRSVEHWAKLRFGLGDGRARRLVAAARVLVDLPVCREAFEAGEITEDHVAELVRAGVTATHDGQAVELARYATVGQLRTGLSFLPPPPPEPEPGDTDDVDDAADPEPDPEPAPDPDPEPEPGARRGRIWVGFGTREDGTWGLISRLDPLDGATFELAMVAARNQLFRARHGTDPTDGHAPSDVTWADAFAHLGRVALDAMDPATAGHPGRAPSDRYVVNLHLRADAPETARIHLGPVLPPDLRRRATCDARVRAWIVDQVGNVGLGRTQHCVDPKLRAVVEARDGGCVVPGCDATRWLEIHHIEHWEHGGPTETWNLAAGCGTHHDAIHRGDLVLSGNPDLGTLEVRDRNGRLLTHHPPTPPGAPAPQAARTAGLPEPAWAGRSGERAQWDCMIWREHPTGHPSERPAHGSHRHPPDDHDPSERSVHATRRQTSSDPDPPECTAHEPYRHPPDAPDPPERPAHAAHRGPPHDPDLPPGTGPSNDTGPSSDTGPSNDTGPSSRAGPSGGAAAA